MSKEAPNLDRQQEASQLLDDFELRKDAEFFSEPSNRVAFLKSLSGEEFYDIAQHVNARVRGFEPRDKITAGEEGGYLPMMKTPIAEQKPEALQKGFQIIEQYLEKSNDSDEQKLRGVGMAAEALIVWVHPFNDGNGRTSRFLGSFIENGTTDTEQLLKDTSNRNERMRIYPEFLRVDNTSDVQNPDLLIDDDERAEIIKDQENLPITEGISLSIKRLLEDKTLQDRVEAETERYQEIRQQASTRRAQAA